MNSRQPADAKTRLAGPGAYYPTALSIGDAKPEYSNVISLEQLAAEGITPSTAFTTGPASDELRIMVDNRRRGLGKRRTLGLSARRQGGTLRVHDDQNIQFKLSSLSPLQSALLTNFSGLMYFVPLIPNGSTYTCNGL
jgi:hypothetical protein